MMEEENSTEEKEVEEVEVEMSENDIDELILKLDELKESKGKINFEIADDMDLLINYKESEESGELGNGS
jgi:hypothetical protein